VFAFADPFLLVVHRLQVTSNNLNEPTATSIHGLDVLALHRNKTNTSKHIPTAQQLVPHVQILNQPRFSSNNKQTSNQVTSTHSQRVKRRRTSQLCSPSRLGFYSPRSKTILRDAKMKYRIYVATQVAFPTTVQALENAVTNYNLSGDEYATETESEREDISVIDAGRVQVVSPESFCSYIHNDISI
jgi:hypothetical protein